MTKPKKNLALLLAAVAGIISLRLPWLTRECLVGGYGAVGGVRGAGFMQEMDLTALTGCIKFDFLIINNYAGIPIWVYVAGAIAANLLQLVNRNSKTFSDMFAISRVGEWLVAIIPAVWIVGAMIRVISSRWLVELHIGSLLGLVAAVVPVLCLAIPSSTLPESTSASRDPDA